MGEFAVLVPQDRFAEGGTAAASFLADFAADWLPEWRVNVCAIWPDPARALEGECWTAERIGVEREALARTLGEWNRRGAGVYFCPNPIRAEATMKRAKDADIAAVTTLHADLDPDIARHGSYDNARAALWQSVGILCLTGPATTWILDTGNGASLFLSLAVPADAPEGRDACREWQRLIRASNGGAHVDATHEPSRLMRLPGLRNLPSESKLGRGYPADGRWSSIRERTVDAVMPAADFAALAEAGRSPNGTVATSVTAFRPDPAPCADDLLAAVMHCPNKGDRAGWVWMGEAIKAAAVGVIDDAGARELWHRWSEKHQPEAEDDIARAWRSFRPVHVGWRHIEVAAREAGWDGRIRDFDNLPPETFLAADPQHDEAPSGERARALADMNANHVFILQGLRPTIARRALDESGRAYWDFTTEPGLRALLRPHSMPGGGCRVTTWMGWLGRRTARGVTLAPGAGETTAYGFLNVWAGFAVTPAVDGTCELFRRHLVEVVCNGDDRHFAYLWRYLAHMVQRTAEKPGVAVVLRGQKGTGKTVVGDYLARIFGQHATKLEKAEQLTGRFNAPLSTAILVQVEEALWAGDKAGEGALKHLITSRELMIERKGIDASPMPNFARLIFTSNEGWVVPASTDERRFFVVDVSPHRARDTTYFQALAAEMDGHGPAALLHALQAENLTGFDVRTAPQTAALRDQVERSEKPVVAWWRGCLKAERISPEPIGGADDWPEVVPKTHPHESFRAYWRNHNLGSHIPPANQLARDLKEWLPGGVLLDGPKPRAAPGDNRGRTPTYRLPPLEECRRAFETKMGGPCEWG